MTDSSKKRLEAVGDIAIGALFAVVLVWMLSIWADALGPLP